MHEMNIRPQSKAQLSNAYEKSIAFLIVATIFLILHQVKGLPKFVGDARGYWELSKAVTLLDFPSDTSRGYFFPALLSPARFLSDQFPWAGIAPYRIYSSILYGYLFAILIPMFASKVFDLKVNLWRRLIVPVFIVVLFPGVIIHPLSDLPAFALLIGGVFCLISVRSTRNSIVINCQFFFAAGFLLYGAYCSRPIYLFPAMLAFFGVIIFVYRNFKIRSKVLFTLVFLLGVLFAAIPQILINLNKHGTYSPAVSGSLFASQLRWGITIQRYETSIDRSAFPGAAVYYLDDAGESLIARNGLNRNEMTIPLYLQTALQNPGEFFGIYGRHFINGLDVRDGEVYTSGRPAAKNMLAAFNYLVIFAGLVVFLFDISFSGAAQSGNSERFFWLFVITSPVLAIIPGAIETRFFLPLHIVLYSIIAFGKYSVVEIDRFRRNAGVIIFIFVVSISMFFAISTSTMSKAQAGATSAAL